MQEVSMAAWRQSILIKAVTRALRFAFGVGARVMFGPWSATPSAYILGLQRAVDANGRMFYPNIFLGCIILLRLGPCSSAACVEAPLIVDRSCFAQSACAVVNLSGRPQACSPRTCRAHAASAPSGTEHPPRTSAPRPCAEGGKANARASVARAAGAAWARGGAEARRAAPCADLPRASPEALP